MIYNKTIFITWAIMIARIHILENHDIPVPQGERSIALSP